MMVPTISFIGCDATIMEQKWSHQQHLPTRNPGIINRLSGVVASCAFLSPQVVRIQLHQRVWRRRKNHHQLSILEMASSSSSPPRRRRVSNNGSGGDSSSSSSGGGGGSSTGSGGRNRGANAASHNRRGHSFRISSKDSTTTAAAAANGGRWPSSSSSSSSRGIKMNTKRPPRWEREGDRLYAEVTKDLNAVMQLSNKSNNDDDDDDESLVGNTSDGVDIAIMMKPTSAQDVCRLLEPWTATIAATDSDDGDKVHELLSGEMKGTMQGQQPLEEKSVKENKSSNSQTTPPPPPPFLWGSLPVGPVLASRLYATGRSEPTSVQRAAFSILTAAVPDNGSQNSYSSNNNDSYPAICNDNSRRNRRMGYPTATKRSGATAKKKTIKRTNAIIASPTGTVRYPCYLSFKADQIIILIIVVEKTN
jgi:hypothetical protein